MGVLDRVWDFINLDNDEFGRGPSTADRLEAQRAELFRAQGRQTQMDLARQLYRSQVMQFGRLSSEEKKSVIATVLDSGDDWAVGVLRRRFGVDLRKRMRDF